MSVYDDDNDFGDPDYEREPRRSGLPVFRVLAIVLCFRLLFSPQVGETILNTSAAVAGIIIVIIVVAVAYYSGR